MASERGGHDAQARNNAHSRSALDGPHAAHSNGAALRATTPVGAMQRATQERHEDDEPLPVTIKRNRQNNPRSTTEMELIARGRDLLRLYQSRQSERGEMLSDMNTNGGSVMETTTTWNGKAGSLSHRNQGPAVENGVDSGHEMETTAEEALMEGDANGTMTPTAYWQEYVEVQGQSAQLLDALERQLERVWLALGDDTIHAHNVAALRDSVTHTIRQKRRAEEQLTQTMEALGPPVELEQEREQETEDGDGHGQRALWITPTQLETLVEEETRGLHQQVDKATARVRELEEEQAQRQQASTIRSTASTHMNGSVDLAQVRKLETRVQEKEELLVSLRESLERVVREQGELETSLELAHREVEALVLEKQQMEKATTNKHTLLQRAYSVKAKQLDQLCKRIELPPACERIKDEDGIIYYRQTDRACAPELEDPRVRSAVRRLRATSATMATACSPRSASGRMEGTPFDDTTATDAWELRSRESSSFDSDVSCEDIIIPEDDGQLHAVDDFETPLPEAWEMRVTTSGAVFFVDRTTNVTTWKDPRILKRAGLSTRSTSTSSRFRLTARANVSDGLKIEIPTEPRLDVQPPSTPDTIMDPTGVDLSTRDPREAAGTNRFDVVFQEKGPIGIHFQANSPDQGAVVRHLVPDMVAARMDCIAPYDQLISVNKNPVDAAPFRHVMLLLQGGLRPLTLTFARDASRSVNGSRLSLHDRASLGDSLDEELVVDDDLDLGLMDEDDSPVRLRSGRSGTDPTRRRSSTMSSTSSIGTTTLMRDDELSVADRIITNVFSLFWATPEQPSHQVEIV